MEDELRPSSSQADMTQDPTSTQATDRRKSGRATRKPELLSQSYTDGTGSKRKRDAAGEDDEDTGEEEEDQEVDDASESESNEEDADEEELREKKRAARKKSTKKASTTPKTKAKSRTTKKVKVAGNGIGGQLALRPAAANGKRTVSRPRKPKVRPSLAAGERGLYAEVFGKGDSSDTVAANWLSRYQRDQSTAMRDMVNFMLRCTGTDLEIDTSEVEDVDNAPTRIDDLQTQYHQLGISEYPLISKAKKFRAFQPVLEEFFAALVQTLHHSSVLYSDENLFENIQIWISALSTSSCRPFRHTSTVISLAIMNTLCDVARETMTSVSTSRKQVESEKKKKSVNQGRVDAIQTSVEEGEKKLEMVDEFLKDGVNIVFVHRYRDIDPRIRCECMSALGQWIRNYREYFFEGQFLRYLGWILSDPVAQTRAVVVEQLRSLYENKDNIAGLRSFTERFRQRMVEMAAQDADVVVRASAVELLDLIRDAGLIEPGDVDVVGRLVFDAEPRVRKAAGRFFVANVHDVFDSTTEELGDEINELFGDEDEDDFASPKRSWIKFKCLVDMLQSYDSQENDQKSDRPVVTSRDALSGTSIDSRSVLATEAIYPHLEELAQWQSLAGYLLYDHSQIAEAKDDDATGTVRSLYKMEEGQEVILLEVLCCAVKLRVVDVSKSDVDKRGRKVKALTEKIPELQEEIAHNLAQIIPQLLNKFGSVPEAASAVLRLEHLVDLDKIQDLQKDATAYTALLNDINKQFLTHSDQDVLTEASVTFLHAKSSDDMKEALESKIQELWDDIIDALSTLSQNEEVQDESSLPSGTLTELINTVTRVSNLASVTDCAQILETAPSARSKGKKKSTLEAPFNTLIHFVKRGLRGQEENEDAAKAETELVINSIRTLLFFFMWKVQSLATALNAGKVSFTTAYFEALAKSREVFAETLVIIMQKRTSTSLDDIRFAATTTLLDLQTLFGTLRHAGQTAENDEDILTQTQGLVHEISTDTQKLIAKIHGIAERTYAKKIRKPLEPAEDDLPASDEDVEKEPSDDEENESNADEYEESADSERLRSTILAEQRLCELTGKIVLAIIGRVIDVSGPQQGQLKKKLVQHKSRLGPNYREVLSFLGERKPRGGAGSRNAKSKKTAGAKNGNTGSNEQKSAERIEDDEEDEEDGAAGRNEMEEDEEEDLRAKELVEDENADQENGDEDDNNTAAPDPDEDEVMGD